MNNGKSFYKSIPALVNDFAISIYGDIDLGLESLSKGLAKEVAEAWGEQWFVCIDTVANLKKCVSMGLVQKNVPIVINGLRCSDRTCSVNIIRAIAQSGYSGAGAHIPQDTPRIITTPSPPAEWIQNLMKTGLKAASNFVERTVWVNVSEDVAAVEHVSNVKGARAQLIANRMSRLAEHQVATTIV